MGDIKFLKFYIKSLFGHDRDDMATELIERFGSLSGVFRATAEELLEIDGMTERVASAFAFIGSCSRQMLLRALGDVSLYGEAETAAFLPIYFFNAVEPNDYCFCLDENGFIRHAVCLRSEGRVREFIGTACRRNAKKAVWVKFDPYPPLTVPSKKRLSRVAAAIEALTLLGIEFVDYIEYCPTELFSLRRAVKDGNGIADINATDAAYSFDAEFCEEARDYISALEKLGA